MRATGSYGKGADMWSVGVIAYVCLSGCPPFNEELQDSIHIHIKEVLKFQNERWSGVSDQAKDFLRTLLVVDEGKRSTALEALEHPWLASGRRSLPFVKSASDEDADVRHSSSIGSLVDVQGASLRSPKVGVENVPPVGLKRQRSHEECDNAKRSRVD